MGIQETIAQAIADFDNIEKAIEESGVDVPYGTDTSEYGNKVREVYAKAVAEGKGVFNAETHYDFPSVGSVDMIYKAQAEKMLYQWNATELKYEALGAPIDVDIDNIELIHGGNANGTA